MNRRDLGAAHGQCGGEGVSQGMPADLAYADPPAQPFQSAASRVVGDRPLFLIDKHEARTKFLAHEHRTNAIDERDPAFAVVLGRADNLTRLRVTDHDVATLQVYIVPGKRKQFADPHAGVNRHENHLGDRTVGAVGEQEGGLFR